MSFSLPDHWVWDSWFADDGERFHLFYLHARKSLGDPELRHRNAAIGHATSADLVSWVDHGPVLTAGDAGSSDGSATWTGSVARGSDGKWRMFYTGSLFSRDDSAENVETILVAASDDLFTWEKEGEFAISADPRWYEKAVDHTWHEEAWRDPWVFRNAKDDQWHMLITARSSGGGRDRGVIGHAVSLDLATWTVGPPLTSPGQGFAHLEVIQAITVEGTTFVLFSCDSAHLTGARIAERGGTWVTATADSTAPFELDDATLLIGENIYAGHAVQTRSGEWVYIGFENIGTDGHFVGRVSDPIPLALNSDRQLVAVTQS
jgi:beta-fructofuranosidase